MKKFILQENLRLFRTRLLEDMSDRDRAYLSNEITRMRRELALLNVGAQGAQTYPSEFGCLASADRTLLQQLVEDSSRPSLLIDPRTGFHIIDLNDGYQAATLTERDKAAGEGLFNVFPDNPDLEGADGVANLFESIRTATRTRNTHVMQIQRYDVRDEIGNFVTRYWQCENVPILNEDGQVVFILHRADDVTEALTRPKASWNSLTSWPPDYRMAG